LTQSDAEFVAASACRTLGQPREILRPAES